MYVVVVLFTVALENAEAMADRCDRQAADSLALEDGCHRFDVSVDPDDPAKILLYEFYDDAAAFGVHLASEHFARFSEDVASWVVSKRVESFMLRDAVA